MPKVSSSVTAEKENKPSTERKRRKRQNKRKRRLSDRWRKRIQRANKAAAALTDESTLEEKYEAQKLEIAALKVRVQKAEARARELEEIKCY